MALASIIAPKICLGCNLITTQEYICEYCNTFLPWLEGRCYQCAGLLAEQSIICENCMVVRPPFARVCALFRYAEPLTKIIYKLKFGGRLDYVMPIGSLMTYRIKNSWYSNEPLPEVIIPVPLSTQRYRTRGYNQSTMLGKIIAKGLHIPIDVSACSRIRNTKMQARLAKKDRGVNLQGAFIAKTRAKHIALVDDVVTTGSTVRAASYALQAAGVEQVDVWAVCRG